MRVERYVLPKYEVGVTTASDWILASDPITGTVTGEYAFGKPVVGEVEIIASRYVGQWEEYARFSGPIDGEAEFELPPVRFVAGVPQAGGQGNVRLDVTVREQSTGYEQQTSKLLTVSAAPATLRVIPESHILKPCLPMSYLIVAQEPDGTPVDADVSVTITYLNQAFQEALTETLEVATGGRQSRCSGDCPRVCRRAHAAGTKWGFVHVACFRGGPFAYRHLHSRGAGD